MTANFVSVAKSALIQAKLDMQQQLQHMEKQKVNFNLGNSY